MKIKTKEWRWDLSPREQNDALVQQHFSKVYLFCFMDKMQFLLYEVMNWGAGEKLCDVKSEPFKILRVIWLVKNLIENIIFKK